MSGNLTDLIGFSGRLAEMRREYGDRIDLPNLGRPAFAALLGVSPVQYEAYERGDRAPTVEFLAVLRRKTGANVDYAWNQSEWYRTDSGADIDAMAAYRHRLPSAKP